MGMKTSLHAFKGMNRDISRSKASNEFAFDAQNIRFTAREGETLLSITNEKGNKDLGIPFTGEVLGYCVINKYLVVFSTVGGTGAVKDYIYRVNVEDNSCTTLYRGNLNFSKSNPIESLGIYENENIQKVYWVDGLNQPRVINITKDILIGGNPQYNNNSFDFVQELDLKEVINVKRNIISNGNFSAGTIQYAFTYYNKYGQESNVFYTTELYNLSHNDRGGSPEDKINNSFTIDIYNADKKFDYIRVYSIQRTSIDATPIVKRIADIELSSNNASFNLTNAEEVFYKRCSLSSITVYEYPGATGKALSSYSTTTYPGQVANNTVPYYYFSKTKYPELILDLGTHGVATFGNADSLYVSTEAVSGPGESSLPIIVSTSQKFLVASGYVYDDGSISYTDAGNTGVDVDPTQLLYIGGESLVASTLTQKDQTLFLGNLLLTREPINSDIKSNLYLGTDIKEVKDVSNLSTSTRTADLGDDGKNGFYVYKNSLSQNTAGFKAGEYYRIGLQFQHKTGKWSEPILIGDIKVPDNHRPSLVDGKLTIPTLKYSLPSSIHSIASAQDYRRVRAVAVFPTLKDRRILTQGMLCPTVFRVGSRKNNTPFSQSSWFIRPNAPYSVSGGDYFNNDKNIDNGAWVEFRHLHALKANKDRGAEIQNITVSPSFSQANNTALQANNDYLSDVFFVDQSVLTLHSPEVEFDDSLHTIDNSDMKMRIVGIINFTASTGDIDIQTSSPTIHHEGTGFYYKTTSVINRYGEGESYFNGDLAMRYLASGLFYKDYLVDDSKNADRYEAWPREEYEYSYMIYPWHRSGSLNNDAARPSDKGTRSAVLKKKVISNLKYSDYNTWLPNYWEPSNGISPVKLFNSNEVSLIKLPIPKSSNINNMNYYGNIDTLLPSASEYGIVHSKGNTSLKKTTFYDESSLLNDTTDGIGDYDGNLKKTKEPVRMKYKSGPHLVVGLNYTSNMSVILPSVNSLNKCDIKSVPFWSQLDKGTITETLFTKIQYQTPYPPTQSYNLKVGDLWLDPVGHYEANVNRGGVLWEYTGYPQETTEWGNISFRKVNVSSGELYMYEGYGSTYYYKVAYNGSYFALQEFETTSNSVYKGISQGNISVSSLKYPYLFLAELYREIDDMPNIFGGTSDDAIKENMWVPVGNPVDIEGTADIEVNFDYGDTWYQRYDCLKTYPFTREDENQVVEIASFMCETRVNIDGRYDRNRGQSSNLNMSPQNFNLFNPVYSQQDNFFNYRILDKDYYKLNKFSNVVTWSKEKTLAEEVDTWANITMANTLDLDGGKGKVNALRTFNDEIYCFQDTGISNILFNSRVQIPASDGIPIEISNGYKVDGKRYLSGSIGCKNKWSIVESPRGLYFVDSDSSSIYVIGNGLTNLSAQYGFEQWAKENCSKDFFKTFYDKNYGDVYFTTDETSLCFSERLDAFTSFMSYGGTPAMFNAGNSFYAIAGTGGGKYNPKLWKQFEGNYNSFFGSIKPYSITFICNQDEPYDKIFNNIEFRADTWDGNTLTSSTFDTLDVWNEYQHGTSSLVMNRNKPSTLQKKFRVWRANVPRDNKNHRDRIRNTWAFVKLSMSNPSTYKTELHDVMVHYFI